MIYILIYTVSKYLSRGAEDEFQIVLHRYLSRIEKVLEKC